MKICPIDEWLSFPLSAQEHDPKNLSVTDTRPEHKAHTEASGERVCELLSIPTREEVLILWLPQRALPARAYRIS